MVKSDTVQKFRMAIHLATVLLTAVDTFLNDLSATSSATAETQ